MSCGYFYDKETDHVIDEATLENELPEVFLFDAMRCKVHPKLSYITMLGKIASAESLYVDRKILDTILEDDELYYSAVNFLCERYTFRNNNKITLTKKPNNLIT